MMIAAFRKEVLTLLSDRGGLVALFLLPVIFIAVLGGAFSGDGPAGQVPGGFQLAVPGNVVLFGFFVALLFALSVLEERDSGTLRRLIAAPRSRLTLLASKSVPYFVVGLVQMAFLFGCGALFFGLEIRGSWLALAVISIATVICATSLGLLLATISGSSRQIGGAGSIVLLTLGLVGGAMVPRAVMPDWMQAAGLWTPHAWALDGFYAIFLEDGVGLETIALEVMMLMAFSVVFVAIGIRRFRFAG